MSKSASALRLRKVSRLSLTRAFPDRKTEIAQLDFAKVEAFDGSRLRKLLDLLMQNPDLFWQALLILFGKV